MHSEPRAGLAVLRGAIAAARFAFGPAAVATVLFVAGCERPDAGPAQLQIDTGEQIYEDFVIQAAEKYSTLHGGYAEIHEREIVPTGQLVELTLPEKQEDNLTSFSVNVTHPAFRYAWTAATLPALGGPFTLPTMQPVAWADYLLEHEVVDYTTVIDHFHRVLESWLPAFGTDGGAQLRRYLPLLEKLATHAGMTKKDKSFYKSEDEARALMLAKLELIRGMSK